MPVQNTSRPNSLQVPFQSYGREIRFLVIFVLTLALLNFVYFLFRRDVGGKTLFSPP